MGGIIGNRYHSLIALTEPFKKDMKGNRAKFITCLCDCGTICTIRKDRLFSQVKPTKSCGCAQAEFASALRIILLPGEVYGRLTSIEDLGLVSGRHRGLFQCICGETLTARLDSVKSGKTASCGCYATDQIAEASTRHGMWGTPTYLTWHSMKGRCSNTGNPKYGHYGGRGITYDPRWEKFENFYEDMGDRPEDMSLDRIDVDGNYCKENCRWATDSVQMHNRRKMQGTTSKYIGVHYNSNENYWIARLCKDGVQHDGGRHAQEESAARAYDRLSLIYYGDSPNFKEDM